MAGETNLPQHYAPGTNGNRGGRPKGLAKRVREALAQREVLPDGTEHPDSDEARIITFLKDVVLARNGHGAKMRDRLEAAKLLFDRGHGKPEVKIDLHADNEAPVAFVHVESATDDELEQLDRAVQAINKRAGLPPGTIIDVTP